MEGRSFLCAWRRTDLGYRVWVKRRPSVAVEAAAFEEADRSLWDAIMAATGDGENERVYDPPPPLHVGRDTGLLGRFTALRNNGRAELLNPDALFTGGRCTRCGGPRGRRTDAIARVSGVEDPHAGEASPRYSWSPMRLTFYAKELVSALTPAERKRCDLRAIDRGPRGKALFELVDAELILPFAAFKPSYCDVGLTECALCGARSTPTYLFDAGTPAHYVAESRVPTSLPSVFAVGRAPRVRLAFRSDRWKKLVDHVGALGVGTEQVGIVDDRLLAKRPKYTVHAEPIRWR